MGQLMFWHQHHVASELDVIEDNKTKLRSFKPDDKYDLLFCIYNDSVSPKLGFANDAGVTLASLGSGSNSWFLASRNL
jgi:hypothetical protein